MRCCGARFVRQTLRCRQWLGQGLRAGSGVLLRCCTVERGTVVVGQRRGAFMTGQLERKGTSATAMPRGSPRRAVPRCGGADGACSVRGISAPVGASHCVAGGDGVAVESERHTVAVVPVAEHNCLQWLRVPSGARVRNAPARTCAASLCRHSSSSCGRRYQPDVADGASQRVRSVTLTLRFHRSRPASSRARSLRSRGARLTQPVRHLADLCPFVACEPPSQPKRRARVELRSLRPSCAARRRGSVTQLTPAAAIISQC